MDDEMSFSISSVVSKIVEKLLLLMLAVVVIGVEVLVAYVSKFVFWRWF